MRADGRAVVAWSSRRVSRPSGQRFRRGVVDEHACRSVGTTVSSAPPRPSATTGRPQAWASTGTMPKSSSPGSTTAAAPRYNSRTSSSATRPATARQRRRCPRRQPGSFRPVTHNLQGYAGEAGRLNGDIDALVRDEGRNHEGVGAWRPAIGMVEPSVHWRVHHEGLAIIVSTDPAGNIV